MGRLDWWAANLWNILNSAAALLACLIAGVALWLHYRSHRHNVEQSTPRLQLRAFAGVFVNEEPWVREVRPDETAPSNALMLVLQVSNSGAVPVRLHAVGFHDGDGSDSPLPHPMTPGHTRLPILLESDDRVPITLEHEPKATAMAADVWVESGSGQRWTMGRREFGHALRLWSETYARANRKP